MYLRNEYTPKINEFSEVTLVNNLTKQHEGSQHTPTEFYEGVKSLENYSDISTEGKVTILATALGLKPAGEFINHYAPKDSIDAILFKFRFSFLG